MRLNIKRNGPVGRSGTAGNEKKIKLLNLSIKLVDQYKIIFPKKALYRHICISYSC